MCRFAAGLKGHDNEAGGVVKALIAKGGGSANKTYLYQETKALLNPEKLESFLTEKMKTLGTAACPPYHLAFVIGGTSAESCLTMDIQQHGLEKTITHLHLKQVRLDLSISGQRG